MNSVSQALLSVAVVCAIVLACVFGVPVIMDRWARRAPSLTIVRLERIKTSKLEADWEWEAELSDGRVCRSKRLILWWHYPSGAACHIALCETLERLAGEKERRDRWERDQTWS